MGASPTRPPLSLVLSAFADTAQRPSGLRRICPPDSLSPHCGRLVRSVRGQAKPTAVTRNFDCDSDQCFEARHTDGSPTHDASSRLASKRSPDILGVRDQPFLSTGLHVIDKRVDLRAHAALVEVILCIIPSCIANRDLVEPLLVRLVEMNRDALDASGNHEEVGAGVKTGLAPAAILTLFLREIPLRKSNRREVELKDKALCEA